jgi:hypothetical protein
MNHSRQRHTQGFETRDAAHDFQRAATIRRCQDEPRPPDMLLRAVPIRRYRGQPLAVCGTHLNADPFAHGALSHTAAIRKSPLPSGKFGHQVRHSACPSWLRNAYLQ